MAYDLKILPTSVSGTYARGLFGELIVNDQKGVFRQAIAMVLFVGLFGMWISGC